VITAQPGSGPTVLRILLGSQLRMLREVKGITREEAGYAIRASGSKISRMELGRVSFKERDVTDLLKLYGVDEDETATLVALAIQANSPGWWHKYGDVLPDWFQVYVGLEEAASLIRLYEVQFVPGLLQTADYARAVVRLGQPGAAPEEIERRISLRMGRQELLTKPGGPRLWAIVDEAALRRPIGAARATDSGHRGATGHAPGDALPVRRSRRRGRGFHHHAFPGARSAGRGLSRTAH
jgi:transcriptional regulator with XRE-family HTH domain